MKSKLSECWRDKVFLQMLEGEHQGKAGIWRHDSFTGDILHAHDTQLYYVCRSEL